MNETRVSHKADAADLGPMPAWDLSDLYPSPASQAVKDDLARAAAEARAIKERYQGKLVALGSDGAALAQAIAAYEALSDTIENLSGDDTLGDAASSLSALVSAIRAAFQSVESEAGCS